MPAPISRLWTRAALLFCLGLGGCSMGSMMQLASSFHMSCAAEDIVISDVSYGLRWTWTATCDGVRHACQHHTSTSTRGGDAMSSTRSYTLCMPNAWSRRASP